MIIFSVILFIVAAVFVILGVLIFRGHTNLINCYHEERVKDKPLYCKKFAQSLYLFAIALTSSGIIGLFGETDVIAFCAVAVLIVGITISTIRMFCVQKKYGGGIF